MSALNMIVPVILRLVVSPVAPGQVADMDEPALTQDEAMIHVPTRSPPQAGVLPHVPPTESPQPERTIIAARQVVPKTDRIVFMPGQHRRSGCASTIPFG